jgi:molybdopterin molybdotransferase
VARQADLLSVEDARDKILSRFARLEIEAVSLAQCAGRALAESVKAGLNLPPFANSSMDGFALQARSTAEAATDRPVRLPVTAFVAAGSQQKVTLRAGEAVRIMTGAPLPEGADSVVPFEDVEDTGDGILVTQRVQVGACVRPAGQDMRSGTPALSAGVELHSPQIALLAALGLGTVSCVRRPVVSILSTGDELVAPGGDLAPGQIYNSNTPMLAAAVLEAGGEPRPIPTAPDDPQAILAALEAGTRADLLITSGGASVGDFDHVKAVLGGSGEIGFWRVRVRPGKPLIFGRLRNVPVLGLPGNPTSAMVTFELFARPAIRAMLGLPASRPEIDAVVDDHVENRGDRRTYARVRLRHESGRFHASLAGGQDSAMLKTLADADGLMVVPEAVNELQPGDIARVLVWRLPL